MKNLIKTIPLQAYTIAAGLIAFFPEFTLDKFQWFICLYRYLNCVDKWLLIIFCKIILFIFLCLLIIIFIYFYRRAVVTREFIIDDSIVIVTENNLFEKPNKDVAVISFDECFNCDVGTLPHQINPSSICGQFIKKYPNIKEFIKNNLVESTSQLKSLYNNLSAYEIGTLIPYEDNYLLLSFAKLNERGSAETTRKDYIINLLNIWQKIVIEHGQRDVYVPIFGSGTLKFIDGKLSQQQLLDIMLTTYEMLPNKIEQPNKLFIVYRPKINFSVWNIRVNSKCLL